MKSDICLWICYTGSEIDADTTTTTAPLYPYGPIAEGKSSADNRRQRSAVKDLSSMDYPRVEEQADSARRIQSNTRKLDIGIVIDNSSCIIMFII